MQILFNQKRSLEKKSESAEIGGNLCLQDGLLKQLS